MSPLSSSSLPPPYMTSGSPGKPATRPSIGAMFEALNVGTFVVAPPWLFAEM